MTTKSLDDWRWCDRLTVIEAAMLAADLNPTEFELVGSPLDYEGKFHLIGDDTLEHTYSRKPEFAPVFRAIRSAILRRELQAEFFYEARRVSPWSIFEPSPLDNPQDGELKLPYEFFLKATEPINTNASDEGYPEIIFFAEPDWRTTSVAVAELRSWMESKGRRPAFFFPERGKRRC